MRWKINPRPKPGDRRYRHYFAFTRVEIGEYAVWLEWYTVHEEYAEGGYAEPYGWWKPLEVMFYDPTKN